jgi:hypothetical protein
MQSGGTPSSWGTLGVLMWLAEFARREGTLIVSIRRDRAKKDLF